MEAEFKVIMRRRGLCYYGVGKTIREAVGHAINHTIADGTPDDIEAFGHAVKDLERASKALPDNAPE